MTQLVLSDYSFNKFVCRITNWTNGSVKQILILWRRCDHQVLTKLQNCTHLGEWTLWSFLDLNYAFIFDYKVCYSFFSFFSSSDRNLNLMNLIYYPHPKPLKLVSSFKAWGSTIPSNVSGGKVCYSWFGLVWFSLHLLLLNCQGN